MSPSDPTPALDELLKRIARAQDLAAKVEFPITAIPCTGANDWALIEAAVAVVCSPALPRLIAAAREAGRYKALLAEALPGLECWEFLESRAFSYSGDPLSPNEWGITVAYQQTREAGPHEQFTSDVARYHKQQDNDTAKDDDPEKYLSPSQKARAALAPDGEGT